MKDVFSAHLAFLSREEGGRERTPFLRWELREGRRVPPPLEKRSGNYLPDARFDDLPEPADVVYGLYIEWLDASEDGLQCHMQFAFRTDHSGEWAQRLRQGSKFRLFEGPYLVARGHITGGPFDLPRTLNVGT